MSSLESTSDPAVTGQPRSRGRVGELLLRAVTAAALAYDAYSHFQLASRYDAIESSVSQGTLFRIEAVLAALAAVLILVVWSRFVVFVALAVAAGGLAAVLLYRYIDIGALGPLPNMFEPVWYPEKVWSAASMAIAAVTALILFFLPRRPSAAA